MASASAALQKCLDCELVAGFCARSELKGDLDRRRSRCQQDVDRLAIERLGGGRRDGGTDRLANEIVLEAQRPVMLGEEACVDQLLDGREESGRGAIQHLGQIAKCKSPSQRSGHRCDCLGSLGEARQPFLHRLPDPVRKARFEKLGPPSFDPHQAFLPHARQQLDEDERTAFGSACDLENARLGFCLHHIARHLRHGVFAQWAQHELPGALAPKLRERTSELGRSLV